MHRFESALHTSQEVEIFDRVVVDPRLIVLPWDASDERKYHYTLRVSRPRIYFLGSISVRSTCLSEFCFLFPQTPEANLSGSLNLSEFHDDWVFLALDIATIF